MQGAFGQTVRVPGPAAPAVPTATVSSSPFPPNLNRKVKIGGVLRHPPTAEG